MADYILESRVWLARARTDVFAFFTESSNLVLLTPASFGLRVVAGPHALSNGAVVDLRMSWLGVPVRWRAFIREWDPPYRFVDVQVHVHRAPADCRAVALSDAAARRAGGTAQLAGSVTPSFSRRGRTRSVRRPRRARFATIDPCMSRLKYLRNGA